MASSPTKTSFPSLFVRRLLSILAVGLILAGGAYFRFYGISWDGGYLFHPDERHLLVMVDNLSLTWPSDLSILLTPDSPWNPGFFAYGSLPMYLLRICANLMGLVNQDFTTLMSSYMVGRTLSALFDLGTVYLVYRLGRTLYREAVGILAAALTALTVLHIQMAHFFTVDTLLTFFVVLTVLLAVHLVRRPSLDKGALLGLVWGMALSTKVSAAALGLPVGLAWLLGVLTTGEHEAEQAGRKRWTWLKRTVGGFAVTGLMALAAFVVFEPYALIDVTTFLEDIFQESFMVSGRGDVPYTRQFIGTQPYLYPIWQTIVWSLGIPLGTIAFGSLVAALGSLVPALRGRQWKRVAELAIPLSWVLVYFGLTGSFHAKFLRYMLPILPFLSVWAAWALWSLLTHSGRWRTLWRTVGVIVTLVVLMGTTLYAFAYLNVYRQEHPWLQATAWICEQFPKSSNIMVEHWDDPLPLLQGTGDLRCYGKHNVSQFRAYDRDDTGKLADLLYGLQQSDYIILSTNRLYNAIPRLPGRYPLTSRYYELLMSEKLGYKLVYYAAVHPSLFGVELVDDTFSNPDLPKPQLLAEDEATRTQINLGRADESFTVYDHPKPLIFQKTKQLSKQELLALFGDVVEDLPEPAKQ